MAEIHVSELHNRFKIPADKVWSFVGTRSIESYTHNYHRYPAKFIPQVVKKLIETYTTKNDLVADVFAGCGTTLVESKIHGRQSVGVDINPVARLITEAKINPVKPATLQEEFNKLCIVLNKYNGRTTYYKNEHPRINYWFRRWEKNKIAYLYDHILSIKKKKARDFFLCALSNILKNCSRWLQDSTKPQIDPNKKIAEPFAAFAFQVSKMLKRNKDFYTDLKKDNLLHVGCKIKLADARNTKLPSGSVSAIITSPPYVTSYEYADIHQLTGYWYEYITDITKFRRNFIGTFYTSRASDKKSLTTTAQVIVDQLSKKETKVAKEVANYFADMDKVTQEMKRILMPGGVVCLLLGNTTLRNVKIKSAEVIAEILLTEGFEIEEIIKRKIPHKHMPPTRDKTTGKFTNPGTSNSKKVYPNEFIIIARKPTV